MERRKHSRRFKLETVKLVRDRGVTAVQAARYFDLREKVLRKWVKELLEDPQHAFPGYNQQKPEQLKIDRLCKKVAKVKLCATDRPSCHPDRSLPDLTTAQGSGRDGSAADLQWSQCRNWGPRRLWRSSSSWICPKRSRPKSRQPRPRGSRSTPDSGRTRRDRASKHSRHSAQVRS